MNGGKGFFSCSLMAVMLMAVMCGQVAAQPVRTCDTPEGKQFDFWLGTWDVTWPGGQAGVPQDETGRGTNVVTRILDDCIVQEHFRTDGYSGMSFSTLKRTTGKWHQTWVDSDGGYLAFSGRFHDGIMELRTEPFENPAGEEQVNRMVWTDIEEDSLTWRWQHSLDGGQTWENVWVIRYVRKHPGSVR